MRARERQVRGDVSCWERHGFDEGHCAYSMQAAAAGNGPTIDTALGVASLESGRLYRVEYHGHRVIWVPAEAESLTK